jgi:protein-disulfide isomerase
VIGAALVTAAFFIWQTNKPVGDIEIPDLSPRPLSDGRAMGNPDASIVIEVYEDFQCPACANYSNRVERGIEEKYIASGEVYYIFRHFPFIDNRAQGNESDQAASASMCAADQGSFWEYHDILFANWTGENQGAFSDRRLIAFAEALGLDLETFTDCFQEREKMDEINADYLGGIERGVNGTPTVFINGVDISPGFVPSLEQVSEIVDQLLAEGPE